MTRTFIGLSAAFLLIASLPALAAPAGRHTPPPKPVALEIHRQTRSLISQPAVSTPRYTEVQPYDPGTLDSIRIMSGTPQHPRQGLPSGVYDQQSLPIVIVPVSQ